jgi:hypothetical protein
MAKLSLASAPKTFKRTINIELLDGSTADVELTFKYKTRSEYAKLLDEVMKAEDGDAKKETAVDVFARLGEGTADFLMKIVDGWDLEDKFTKANVVKLIDSFPAVSNEITEVYRVAILEGRAKN